MEETQSPIDVIHNSGLERARWTKWIPPLVLLILVSVLVGVAVLSRQPLSIWNTADIALFVLAALLCTLVAVSLALTGCSDWLNRMEQSGQTMVAQILAVQDTQTQLCEAVHRSGLGSNGRASQEEGQQRLVQDGVTRLTGGLQTVASNVAALSEALQAQREATSATLAALAGDLQQLRGLTQTIVGAVTGAAQERAAANHSLREALTVATGTLQDGQKTLQAQVEKVTKTDREMSAAVAALTAGYGQLINEMGPRRETTRSAPGGIGDVARKQTAVSSKASSRGSSRASSGGRGRHRPSKKASTPKASKRRTHA